MHCYLCEKDVDASAKHCRYCDKCVKGFDHHWYPCTSCRVCMCVCMYVCMYEERDLKSATRTAGKLIYSSVCIEVYV